MKGVECNFGNGIDANFYTQNIPIAKNVDLNLKNKPGNIMIVIQ